MVILTFGFNRTVYFTYAVSLVTFLFRLSLGE